MSEAETLPAFDEPELASAVERLIPEEREITVRVQSAVGGGYWIFMRREG